MVRTDSARVLDQTLHLRDGRTLGYAEYGVPEGKALFYFGASRLEARFLTAPATQTGVRLIGIARPGMGLSDFPTGCATRCILMLRRFHKAVSCSSFLLARGRKREKREASAQALSLLRENSLRNPRAFREVYPSQEHRGGTNSSCLHLCESIWYGVLRPTNGSTPPFPGMHRHQKGMRNQ